MALAVACDDLGLDERRSISQLDQAVAAEDEARARREELETEVASIKAELEPANAPEPLPAVGSTKERKKGK